MWFSIPENAILKWQSELFRAYEREQEMFDGSTKIFSCVRRFNAVHGIVIRNWKIVLCNQKQPHKDWHLSFVTWMVPWWVDSLDQMKKELREETWLYSNAIELFWVNKKNWSIKYQTSYYIIKDPIIVWKQQLDPWWEQIELIDVSFDECIDKILNHWLDRTWLRAKILEMKVNNSLHDFRKNLWIQ